MSNIRKGSWKFWKDIILKRDGSINIRQLKKELSDFYFVMEQVPKVYCNVTGDKLSKIMYKAELVNAIADDYMTEKINESILSFIEEAQISGVISRATAKKLENHFAS